MHAPLSTGGGLLPLVVLGAACTGGDGAPPAGTVEGHVAAAVRGPGDPHPYVVGQESVGRYLTVAAECGRAGLVGLD